MIELPILYKKRWHDELSLLQNAIAFNSF